MAKIQKQDPILVEIRELLKKESLIMGADEVLKNLKLEKLSKIFVSSNLAPKILVDIENFSEMSGVELVKLDIKNEELGATCKKPFSISVIGVIKKREDAK